MAKAFGTLMFRGIMGIISIAATAVITVLVQRYLYEKTGTPVLTVPPATAPSSLSNQPEAESQQPENQQPKNQQSENQQSETLALPSDSLPPDSTDAEFGVSPEPESVQQGDRPTRIMEQFWDKLNQ